MIIPHDEHWPMIDPVVSVMICDPLTSIPQWGLA